jgi:adenosylcobinamide-GDP ribazoletransferase
MFCAVPLPFHVWDDRCANLVLPCFPLTGAVIGALWWGICELLILSGIHIVFASAVLALLPFLVTGFLHLDGYVDTNDAVLSRKPLEDKLRILKDPHAGAFGVITTAVLFVLQFAALYVVVESGKRFTLLIVITVISRCCSSMSIMCLKPMPQSGYANMFRQNTGITHKAFVVFTAACSIALSFLLAGAYGVGTVLSVVLGYTAAMAYAYVNLKGVSGELAGYSLGIGELCGLFALAVI